MKFGVANAEQKTYKFWSKMCPNNCGFIIFYFD